uniref:t-SNARE coiled-coil homology domain-containing protein n=1 Tax=Oryza barthii TaxID=65489 RepID=A0A0D3GAJ7_9ORYZ
MQPKFIQIGPFQSNRAGWCGPHDGIATGRPGCSLSDLRLVISPFHRALLGFARAEKGRAASRLLASSRILASISLAGGRRDRDRDRDRGRAKMSVIDILTRVDSICKKYDKYDVERLNGANVAGEDPFARLYGSVDADINECVEKAEAAKQEKNRATVVALNAEIRRTKAKLVEEDLPKLQRLALKKVKGLTKEELATRSDLVAALPDRIQSIPDGSSSAKKNGTWGASGSRTGGAIKFDTSDGNFDDEYFKGTEESNQFRREYEMRKMKQDEGLDIIGEGLETLKNMASDMNEELDRQVPLMDEMDEKVDRANTDLKNTNVRLKETVLQLRSSRNFCIDIVLLCVILGIAAYLYNMVFFRDLRTSLLKVETFSRSSPNLREAAPSRHPHLASRPNSRRRINPPQKGSSALASPSPSRLAALQPIAAAARDSSPPRRASPLFLRPAALALAAAAAAMSAVNITNVAVLDNPTAFLNPFQFEISYECLIPLDDDLEWKLIYVGSAEDENYDQQLESVLVGPVNVGTYRFVLQADPPDPSKIREEDIIGVTVLLLTCSYMGQEFMRVGYYVNNDYDDEQLREEPPAKLLIDRVQRNILADKPRVTKFPINFHPEPSTSAGQQQQEPQTASPENHTGGEGSKPAADQ